MRALLHGLLRAVLAVIMLLAAVLGGPVVAIVILFFYCRLSNEDKPGRIIADGRRALAERLIRSKSASEFINRL